MYDSNIHNCFLLFIAYIDENILYEGIAIKKKNAMAAFSFPGRHSIVIFKKIPFFM